MHNVPCVDAKDRASVDTVVHGNKILVNGRRITGEYGQMLPTVPGGNSHDGRKMKLRRDLRFNRINT
jgi:hypothetical protein